MMDATPIQLDKAAPARPFGPHVLIIGGGASGVILAAQLLSRNDAAFRVTIVEGRHLLGCGVAYSTTDPDHLLNTRAQNMSAYPDRPQHFIDWLQGRPEGAAATGHCFVSRATYGAYMAGLLDGWSGKEADGRLGCVRQSCLQLRETANGVAATLEDGQTLIGDMAVLATGHVQPGADPGGALTSPWSQMDPVDPDARIVIVGTGLTMVDCVLSLLNRGHRGQILSISRRGLLPRGHIADGDRSRRTAVGGADVGASVVVARIGARGRKPRRHLARCRRWRQAACAADLAVSADTRARPVPAPRGHLVGCPPPSHSTRLCRGDHAGTTKRPIRAPAGAVPVRRDRKR